MNSRRTFLKQVYGATLALGTASALPAWAMGSGQSDSIAIPGEDGMIVRSARFFDLETPVEYFDR